MTHFNYDPDGGDNYIGLGGKLKPVPCSDRALKLAAAVLGVVNTQRELEEAYDKVPNYTAQHDPEDYYAVEQEKFYRACERLERVMDSDRVIYEIGDRLELARTQHGRRFGVVKDVTQECDTYRYAIALIDEKGRESDRILDYGRDMVKGLSGRVDWYEAHKSGELAPL